MGGPDDVIVQSSGAGAGGITMQRFRDLGEIAIHVKAKGAASRDLTQRRVCSSDVIV